MSQPITKKSVDAQSSTGAGDVTRTLGHYQVTLFVVVRGLDAANDTLTVTVEGSPDRDHWANIGEPGAEKEIGDADLTEDPDNAGAYTASVTAAPNFHEFVRARVSEFTDDAGGDLEVDAWVMIAGNAGQGRKGTSRKGPVTDL